MPLEFFLLTDLSHLKRDDGRVRLIPPPWRGKLSGFTLLFEAFLIQMCRSMPVHPVSKITRGSDYRQGFREKLWEAMTENFQARNERPVRNHICASILSFVYLQKVQIVQAFTKLRVKHRPIGR